MRIVGLDIASCPVQLPEPIHLGSLVIRAREYLVLRIRTDDGRAGFGVGYPRGGAVVDILAQLGRQLLGADPLLHRALTHGLEQANLPGRAGQVRALSAIDLALWDLAAKAMGQPVYRLLGGYRTRVPLMAVAGYRAERRSIDDIVAEVLGLADAGYRLVKLVLRSGDPTGDRETLAAVGRAVAGRVPLAVDAHWSWSNLDEALWACRMLDDLGLAFIEDPFTPLHWRLTGELGSRLRTPIAAGEDTLGTLGFRDLLESVSILRIDATASGGVTGAMQAVAMAAAAGRRVMPHVFTALHGQLAAACPEIPWAEIIPAAVGSDPIDALLHAPPRIEDGELLVDDRPGIGLDIDWAAVKTLAARLESVGDAS
jgi:L-alanine-DL-glutamate epimerase-like enolase superfamily enzyme